MRPSLGWHMLSAPCAGVMLAAVLSVSPARGQLRHVHVAEHLTAGAEVNVFAAWDGDELVHGLYVELPAGWQLTQAAVLRHGYEPVPVDVQVLDEGRYRVAAARGLTGLHDLILRLQAGDLPGPAVCSLTPFVLDEAGQPVLREADRLIEPVYLAAPPHESNNRALACGAGRGPDLLLRRAVLPDLGTGAAYTVEFWMKTTGLNEVLLSTWDGDERTSYPMELMVGPNGRLLYYRGQPGQHQPMASRQPVADGQWHHVAVTNDPAHGWMHLYLDGLPVDSLFSSSAPAIEAASAVALGGPLPAAGAQQPDTAGYGGLLDELRFWSSVRSFAEIRRTMRQPLPHGAGDPVVLGFEEAVPEALLVQAAHAASVPADLVFRHEVRNLRADVAGDQVQLYWETQDQQTESFVIERSADRRTFVEVGRVPAEVRDEASGVRPFRFTDTDAAGRVLLYRIRQRFKDGTEQVSGTIKLGLGELEREDVVLVGNFPNPFQASTTITYEVYEAQRVRLSIWDLSGQQVVQLVDKTQGPGSYEVPFEANELPSGVYFVRLQTPVGVKSSKMILMK